MQEIEVLNFHKNMDSAAHVIAEIEVLIKDKMQVWVKLFRSKQGSLYCKIPNVKIKDEWFPVFKLTNAEAEKRLMISIKEAIEKEYGAVLSNGKD